MAGAEMPMIFPSFPPQVAHPPSSEEESLESYSTISDPLGLGASGMVD